MAATLINPDPAIEFANYYNSIATVRDSGYVGPQIFIPGYAGGIVGGIGGALPISVGNSGQMATPLPQVAYGQWVEVPGEYIDSGNGFWSHYRLFDNNGGYVVLSDDEIRGAPTFGPITDWLRENLGISYTIKVTGNTILALESIGAIPAGSPQAAAARAARQQNLGRPDETGGVLGGASKLVSGVTLLLVVAVGAYLVVKLKG